MGEVRRRGGGGGGGGSDDGAADDTPSALFFTLALPFGPVFTSGVRGMMAPLRGTSTTASRGAASTACRLRCSAASACSRSAASSALRVASASPPGAASSSAGGHDAASLGVHHVRLGASSGAPRACRMASTCFRSSKERPVCLAEAAYVTFPRGEDTKPATGDVFLLARCGGRMWERPSRSGSASVGLR